MDLDTSLPLPIIPVKWRHGWQCNIGILKRLELIDTARFETCQYLFSWHTLDAEQKLNAIVTMERYANELVVVCTNKSFTGIKRMRPMQFEWCFPAEPDPLCKLGAASMRSTLPAFEYACVSSCICIGYAEAGMFELCMKQCKQTVDTLLKTVTNSAQWARLRRQGLPLQLLPSWLYLLAAKIDHRAQLCSIQKTATQDESTERNTTLVYLTRGAEDTASRAVVAARALLLDQKFLLHTQVDIANSCYVSAVEEAHRIRVQCLLQDAECALFPVTVDVFAYCCTIVLLVPSWHLQIKSMNKGRLP
jgi:hypothetical protein